MRVSISPPRVSAARLCAFNVGIQLVWGAILAVELQRRIIALSPSSAVAVSAYATTAAAGAAIATVVQLLAGALSDARRARGLGRQLFYASGVVLTIPAIAWLLLAPSVASIGLAFGVLEITMNVAGGPYQAIIPDFVERDRRGIASSWMSAYQSIGSAVGLAIAGAVSDLRVVAGALIVPFIATYGVSAGYARTLEHAPPGAVAPMRATRALIALLFSRGLINVGFFTLLGFLAFYVRDTLGSRDITQTGLIFLTFTLAGVAGAAAAARVSDRVDKRLIVTVATAIIALALAVLALAGSFAVAYGAAGVAGFAWGAFATADWALATTTLPQETMATMMGIWNVATTIPQVIAPLATGPLVNALNAKAFGSGPRAAIGLALVEFVLGGAAIWLVPAPQLYERAGFEQPHDPLRDDGRGIGVA
jgi:MFS family permease